MSASNRIRYTLLAASTLTVLSGTAVAPAMPAIADHFSDHPDVSLLVRLILTSPAISIVLFSPLVGRTIDDFGRRKLYLASFVLYAVAGTAGFYLDSIYAIIASRVVLGLAVTGIMTTTTALIGDYFVGDERIRLLGAQGAFMAAGGMVYLVLAGLLSDLSWRLPFLVYLLSLVILPLAFLNVPEPEVEKHTDNVPHGVLKIPVARILYATCVVYVSIYYLMPVLIPFHMDEQLNTSNTAVGGVLAASTMFSTLAGAMYARFRSRLNVQAMFAMSFGIVGTGFIVYGLASSLPVFLAGAIITGFGAGFAFPNMSLWITEAAPDRIRGRAIGGLTMSIFLGTFVSAFVAEPLVTIAGGNGGAFLGASSIVFGLSLTYLIASVLTRRVALS